MMAISAEDVLIEIIDHLTGQLDELKAAYRNVPMPDYARGTYNAYIECLQAVQKWDGAKDNGLDFVIEEEFPPE